MPGMDGLALVHNSKNAALPSDAVLMRFFNFDSKLRIATDGGTSTENHVDGKASGEHLERWPICFVSSSRQTEEDHRSFAIEAQKRRYWLPLDAPPLLGPPASNPFSGHCPFASVLFRPAVYHHFNSAKTHPVPALDAVTDNYRGFR